MDKWEPYKFDKPLNFGGGYAIYNIFGASIIEPDFVRMGIKENARQQAIDGLDELIGILNRRFALESFTTLWFALERARATMYLADWIVEAAYMAEDRYRSMFGPKLIKED